MKINKINGRYVLSNNGEYLSSADKVSALQVPAVYEAAPELLEVLENTLFHLESFQAIEASASRGVAIAEIKAAITKAEGK